MPIPIQNLDDSSAAAAGFGLKGRVALSFDEQVVPVAVMQDFSRANPNSKVGRVGAASTIGAGMATDFNGIGLQPGPGGILVINQISVNEISGAASDFSVRILDPADIAALTVVGTSLAFDFNSQFVGGLIARNGAIASALRHTALLGDVIHRLGLLADTQGVIDFPGGYALYGDDPAGPITISVWNDVLQSQCEANFQATYYRNKG